jgi:hypothetical protein
LSEDAAADKGLAGAADQAVKLITFIAAPAAALGFGALYVQFNRLGAPLSLITLQDAARAGLLPSLVFGLMGAYGVSASRHPGRTVWTVVFIIAMASVLVPIEVSDKYGDAMRLLGPQWSGAHSARTFAAWLGVLVLRVVFIVLTVAVVWALESWREGRNIVRDLRWLGGHLRRLLHRACMAKNPAPPASEGEVAAPPAFVPAEAATARLAPAVLALLDELRRAVATISIFSLLGFIIAFYVALDVRFAPVIQEPWDFYIKAYSPLQLAKYSAYFACTIALVSAWAYFMVGTPRRGDLEVLLPVANWLIAVALFWTFLYYYSLDIYRQIPQGLGGGRPEQLVIWFKADDVSPAMQNLMGRAACADQGKVVQCRVRAVTTSTSVIVIPEAGHSLVVGRTSVTGLMTTRPPLSSGVHAAHVVGRMAAPSDAGPG